MPAPCREGRVVKRTSFNAEWSYRPRRRSFLETPDLGASWTPVTLPHDAMLTQPRDPAAGPASGYFPGGTWEYRKSYHAPEGIAEQHLVLEFEGVYRDALVELNGDVIARRPNGYTQFHVDLDEHLRAGEENVLRVEATAGGDSRWYSGAGIYRPVSLFSGGLVHVAPGETRITTPDVHPDKAVVEICAVVENRTRTLRTVDASVTVTGPDGSTAVRASTPVTVSPGRPAVIRQRLLVGDPQLWSVDAPHLYECRIDLLDGDTAIDEETTAFGIRSLQLDPRSGLRINGSTVVLRGACVHHDNGVLGAATIDRADERRVELLKAAGFNALRSAHNPMSRAMLEACDRLGMLVMDEAFDMWTRAKTDHDYAGSFETWWEPDLLAMVRKDINHPSVVLYSIGNEIPEIATPSGRQWNRRLAECLRAADPTRFVTNGVNALLVCPSELVSAIATVPAETTTTHFGVNTLMAAMHTVQADVMRSDVVDERTEEIFAALDVAGYNYLHDRYEMDSEKHPQRVIVGTEAMPAAIRTTWSQVQQLAHLIGDFCWTGWDYLGEAGIGRISHDPADSGSVLGAYPHLTATSGDLDITGHRLPISYYRETIYGLRQEPYVVVQPPAHHGVPPRHRSPWSWTDAVPSWTWPDAKDMPVAVTIYSQADEVEILLNGRPQGRHQVGIKDPCRVDLTLAYEPGDLTTVAYAGGQETGRTSLRTASGDVLLGVQVDRSRVRADDTDLAFVAIRLEDSEGTTYTCADRRIDVSVTGAGVLQGIGSADPQTEDRFDSTSCTTYQGRALAVVRPRAAGDITVSVTTTGCAQADVHIRAEAPWEADSR